MEIKINKLPQSVVEINVVLTWAEVTEVYEKLINEVVETAEIKGFRKGKAPRDLVEKNLNKQSFYEEVLKKIVSDSYSKAVTDNNLKPIIYPKVEVVKAEENKDWEYKALISEFPEVELPENYKDAIAKDKAARNIWVPGKDEEKPKEETRNDKLNKNLEYLMTNGKFGISELLLDDEINKQLAELLEEIKKLGLTLEQYLTSTGRTSENLRAEYKEKAEKTLKIEFLLSVLAEKEGITVSDEEVNKALEEIKDVKTKEVLANSKYQLASLLRRQKTLDFVADL